MDDGVISERRQYADSNEPKDSATVQANTGGFKAQLQETPNQKKCPGEKHAVIMKVKELTINVWAATGD